jgi:hypothetical protein
VLRDEVAKLTTALAHIQKQLQAQGKLPGGAAPQPAPPLGYAATPAPSCGSEGSALPSLGLAGPGAMGAL